MTENATVDEQLDATNAPSAAERDAAKRAVVDNEQALTDADFEFVTKQVSTHEKAAVIAALQALRAEETSRVKHVSRIERQPWRRSQRVARSIDEFVDLSERN